MRIDQMAAFIQIAQCRSLKEAGKILYMTPQALSSSVSRMEKELGVKLMERSQMGYELTPEGIIFRETAVRVLKEYEKGLKKIGGVEGREKDRTGVLEIYGNLVFQKVLLPEIVEMFRDKYPNYSIRTVTSDRKTTCRTIREQDKDRDKQDRERIGFVGTMLCDGVEFDADDLNGLETHLVLEGKLAACVSRKSVLARHKRLSLKTIASYPLICFSVNGQEDYDRLFCGYGSIRKILTTDSVETWLDAAKEYHGIALIQKNVLEQKQWRDYNQDNSQIVELEIAEDVRCRVYLVGANQMSSVIKKFVDDLKRTGRILEET